MELLDGETLRRLIIERYSKNPKGWRFTVSPSRSHGFFDAFVSSSEEAWHLKLDTIFKPSPLVLGAKTELEASTLNAVSPIEFGYRRLDASLMSRLLGGQDDPRGVAALLASREPVVPESGESYAQGPFVLAQRGAVPLVNKQEQLDETLSAELLRLVRRKYPSYG